MKKYFNTLLSFMLAIAFVHLSAQEWIYPAKDSLSYFLQQRDLTSYFRSIKTISDTAYENEDENTILEMGLLLQQDFNLVIPGERLLLRRTAIYVAQNLSNLTGSVDQTLKIYLVAHENVENQVTLDDKAWNAENKISNLYTMKGDYEKADYFSNLVESSLKYYHKTEQLSRFYTNKGTKSQWELKEKEAIAYFKKGFGLADSISYPPGIFSNALCLAGIYMDNKDLDSSGMYLHIAAENLPNFEEDKNYLDKKSGLESEYARWNLLQKKYPESIQLYKASIQTLSLFYTSKDRREFAKIYNSLANAYLWSGELDSAVQNIQLGLKCLVPDFDPAHDFPSINQLYPENSFIDLFDTKAHYYQKLDSISPHNSFLEKALSSIKLALHANDIIRNTFLGDPSKLISIQSNKELIGNGISILHQLSVRNATHDYYDEARSFFNRSKSILYSEKNQRNQIVELMSEEEQKNWRILMNKNLELYNKKAEAHADINSINGEILSVQEQIDFMLSKYEEPPLMSIPEQYVEYFMGEKDIYTISELNQQQIFTRIGNNEEFQSLMQRLNEYLLLKGLSMDEIILQDMFHFLMKPFMEIIPEHFVIIPDGTIGLVPFEMLKDGKGKYLIAHSTIAYAYEYVTYQSIQNGSSRTSELFCLAPQYPIKAKPGSEISRGSIYHLPFAKMEVDSIQHLFGDNVMTSESGDKKEWEKNISSSTIFHYAGHAIIHGDQSYLAFDSQGDEIKQLTGSEIRLMHHPLDLVVLSACETGLGKLEQGEGIRSLGRSFMESGAQATIISLWNVNDKSTAFIMTDFYKHLKAGMTKDEALRQAKLNYLKITSTQNSHPYFWAAFIPAGDMRALKY
jgi:CHAT domain-containing protein